MGTGVEDPQPISSLTSVKWRWASRFILATFTNFAVITAISYGASFGLGGNGLGKLCAVIVLVLIVYEFMPRMALNSLIGMSIFFVGATLFGGSPGVLRCRWSQLLNGAFLRIENLPPSTVSQTVAEVFRVPYMLGEIPIYFGIAADESNLGFRSYVLYDFDRVRPDVHLAFWLGIGLACISIAFLHVVVTKMAKSKLLAK